MTRWWFLGLAMVLALAGCQQEMAEQPRYEAYERAPDWPGNASARPPVAGTVARDARLEPVPQTLTLELNRELLEQGRQRYEIFCAPCHGITGKGEGMVVQRGFPAPPSLHESRLRAMPMRYVYDVITDGYGVMYSYSARVTPDERWAVAAYIRALQLSQHASTEDLTDVQRAELEVDQ
ncbi:c-type cytochrome [Marinobacter salicampi]|uniref:c-type cytochrome n=1 Tax=Marinobacter salicampi TaxID=435907 RepID=UPI001F5F48E2|nr:cytochrome c [Marinobacter salicampi]